MVGAAPEPEQLSPGRNQVGVGRKAGCWGPMRAAPASGGEGRRHRNEEEEAEREEAEEEEGDSAATLVRWVCEG